MKDNDKSKETGSKSGKTVDTRSLIIGILAAVLVGVIGFNLYSALKETKFAQGKNESTESNLEDAVNSSLVQTEVKGDDIKTVVDTLTEFTDNIKNNNGYVQVYTGQDEYDTYIYNKNNEVVAQGNSTAYVSVFRNDGKVIRYTDTIAVAENEDIDIMSIVDNTLKAVDGKTVKLYKVEQTLAEDVDTDTYYTEYLVDIVGEDNVKKMYSSVDSTFGDTMVQGMYDAVGEDWEPHFKLIFFTTADGAFTVACHVVIDDTDQMNWYFDGYLNVYDWSLPEEWYTNDFSDTETSETLLTNLIQDLHTMISKYAEDNGIDTTTDEENTESTEAVTGEVGDTTTTVNEDGETVTTTTGEISLPAATDEQIKEAIENREAEETVDSTEN